MFSKLKKNNFNNSVFYILAFDSNIVHVRHLYYFFLLILYRFINVQITFFSVLQKTFSD